MSDASTDVKNQKYKNNLKRNNKHTNTIEKIEKGL